MEKISAFRLIAGYLRRRALGMVAFCVFAAIFLLVFSLYDLPLEAVGYAGVLCLLVACLLVPWDFLRFYRRHRTLQELRDRITLGLSELPPPRNLLEADYQALLRCQWEDKVRTITGADLAFSEMMDYYTLWAHQIKTPIAAMRLLLQSGGGRDGAELELELFRVEQYVEMVLSYLRLSGGSSDWVLRYSDLDGIVRQAVRKYAKLFVRKKLSLTYEGVQARVLTDEKWLLFVLEQIIDNALKYTRQGGITIRLDGEKTLVIEDTGIGIAPEDLPRIFEKGYTGYNGRGGQKSTGIGLYLCRKVLGRLSHGIAITSKLGRGTRVEIDLSEKPFTGE